MKILGQIVIFAAFLVGAFLAVLDPFVINWAFMVPTLAAGVAGLFWYKRAHHAESRADHKLSGNIGVLERSLDNMAIKEVVHLIMVCNYAKNKNFVEFMAY